MIEKIYFPPPIYRLDKVNTYMISKLHNYLTKSKEISKDVFDEAIFTKIFIKDEIEQSKKELLEVGKIDRRSRIEPLTMGFDRSAYEYSKDPELIELEKQFYKFYIISLKKHLQKIKRKEKIEAVKPDEVEKIQTKPTKPKKEFKDFFNPDVKIEIIEKIQNDFNDLKGKKMAYLIYLLHKEFKVINYSVNSRTDSRKHFVSLLKGTDFRMAGIDKYFELNDVILLNPRFENDNDYFDIKEKLLKTIK